MSDADIDTFAVDPIIAWPASSKLRPMMNNLQGLNPSLNLQCGIDVTEASEETYTIDDDPEEHTKTVGPYEAEYLVYDGTASDVFTIVIPRPVTQDEMSGLTEVNRESWEAETDIGDFQTGPRRIERTADGNLLIRPRSWSVEQANGRFAIRFHGDDMPFGAIGRFQARWGIFRERHELWEVDFGWLPEWFGIEERRAHDPRLPKGDEEYWRTTPIGTFSFIDRFDLPIEAHYARARAILAAGSEFAVVGDIEHGEVRVFRLSGVELHTEDFRLPEMPWFEVPVGLKCS